MRTAPALLAVLALSACAETGDGLGLGALGSDVFSASDGSAEGSATTDAETMPGSDMPLPPPRGQATAVLPPPAPGPDGDAVAETAAAPDIGIDASAAEAPHVYMALQPDRGGPVSIVFAIDTSRDNTPSDEPAIRITPEETDTGRGRCNPQQLRYYKFPDGSAARPVYGPEEAARGVGARELPEFMATAVSSEMMERGIAAELDDTRPQNVCTRKLFQQTIIAASTGQG